ncbi:hypothetical protein LEP1GSC103_3349 [Leptospira borgpetersenii serovar Javanica str. UI 09931]|uniref:Integrase catalytic domain-containing protein n=1 Tax=Leptospira borgpetersenii serovar Javanica str. UI 09931 TaxID=1049767 RepID=A0AAV3JIZ2_LEPBO|nr:hypothetical protein LEP1GSC101_0010 [Leptospira borgpetersenii str. UI 09149]EPG59656.1 hypothetical protein LEP1GSC103_3349 [Leptospira borgpetersenii serovar Javanica str. UI 09931]PTM37827.1 hypothetical protein CLV95_1562 [Leptospira borgpetersenii serovar Javanica]
MRLVHEFQKQFQTEGVLPSYNFGRLQSIFTFLQRTFQNQNLRYKKEFETCFREYGLPNTIRTDNGVPLAEGLGIFLLFIWWGLS